jgi:hypothetical protein
LAFFSKNVRRLSCDIGPVRFPSRATPALQRLRTMIINIEGLENLELYFKSWDFKPWPGFDWDLTTDLCIPLLQVVAKRCTCLTLSHNSVYCHW